MTLVISKNILTCWYWTNVNGTDLACIFSNALHKQVSCQSYAEYL